MEDEIENPTAAAAVLDFADDMDSCCSTPYVSAPSSPGRGTPLAGFYYSAPASPMHFVLSSAALKSYPSDAASAGDSSCGFEFDFSATLPCSAAASPEHMTSADELFFNGQIRPMKLSTHLQRPQILDPLMESDDAFDDDQTFARGRDLKLRAGSLRRRTRSMSPMRSQTTPFDRARSDAAEDDKSGEIRAAADGGAEDEKGGADDGAAPCASRSSSAGRSSKRWVFLKEFLYRSKSEGRNEGHKFWGSISFSPVNKEKKSATAPPPTTNTKAAKDGKKKAAAASKISEGGKRRGISPSAHELHYAAKRAQAEEMRKKTFLPYRQGLLGCLGFSSKGYGAMNGFARAFTTVSSR